MYYCVLQPLGITGLNLFCLESIYLTRHDANHLFHHISKGLYCIEMDFRLWFWGPLSTINSFSCSLNQFEMIWSLWRGILSCWKQPSEDMYSVVIKGLSGQQQCLGSLWCLNDAHLMLRSPKCTKKLPNTTCLMFLNAFELLSCDWLIRLDICMNKLLNICT